MFKNDLVCITRQHCVAEGARQSLRKQLKKNIKLVFNPKNDQINFWCVFFLSLCLFGLLDFELETPTANTGSTLLGGLRVRVVFNV